MLHSELYTAIQEGLKINVMIFDNSGWGCIENLQNNQGTKTFGTVFKARNPESGLLDGSNLRSISQKSVRDMERSATQSDLYKH
jgi:3D-(3,5/4)-trihydroxycyclohexane-1,2-dione acylhydrolase (decyclizing)